MYETYGPTRAKEAEACSLAGGKGSSGKLMQLSVVTRSKTTMDSQSWYEAVWIAKREVGEIKSGTSQGRTRG